MGGFTDWQVQRDRAEQLREAQAPRESAKEAPNKESAAARSAPRAVKLSFKEQRELDALPERIASLEAEQKTIAAQLEDGSIFAKDAAEGTRLTERYGAIEEELLIALERWEELESKRK